MQYCLTCSKGGWLDGVGCVKSLKDRSYEKSICNIPLRSPQPALAITSLEAADGLSASVKLQEKNWMVKWK